MRQLVILAALLLVLAAATLLASRVALDTPSDAATLTTTGFILLAAYALGELFRRLRLPALLGYLAAGMLFGPSLSRIVFGPAALPPIDEAALHQLALVNMLAIGVIGTLGGGEIRIADLRADFRKIAAVTVMVFALVLPTIAGVVLGLVYWAPQLVPFLAQLPIEACIAAALLFGALAVGMSPSATLALLLEVRAHGRFTSLVLGIVVLADLVLVATFLLALALAKLLVSPEGFSLAGLTQVLPQIATEFGWAILLGILVGVAFIAYLRLIGREILLFSLGIVFVTSFVASRLHAETLLAFLVGGFVVQNFSKHGHKLIEAFERIALPVFVIYFTTQAANLDLVSVTVYLPLTLLLVAVRCGLFYFAIGAAARLARVDDKQRGLLRISFFSQGGIDLVLAAMVAQAIPGWGAELQTVTVATILIYIVLGPPLLAGALDRVGESAAARERGQETLEARRTVRAVPRHEPSFASLEVGDPVLDARLASLRELVTGIHTRLIRDTIGARGRRRREAVAELAASITAALDPAGSTDAANELDARRLARRLQGIHVEVARAFSTWSRPDFPQLEPAVLEATFDSLASAERFGAAYRVTRDLGLFEPRGNSLQRLLRAGRRVRRRLLGPGMRTVPVGRLWRYHVALDVPVLFWTSVSGQESRTWSALFHHYRAAWRAIDDILAGRPPGAGSPDEAASSGAHAGAPESDPTQPPPSTSPMPWLAKAHERARTREQALTAALEDRDVALVSELETGLAASWDAFLDSVEIAGTLEHPAWRYRVSSRYDAAQAAKGELHERITRDLASAAGMRDATAALAHASHMADHARRAGEEARERLGADVRAGVPALERALQACAQLGTDGAVAPDTPSLSASLAGIAADLDRCARRLSVPDVTSERRGLAHALAVVPEQLAPSSLARSEDDEPTDKRTPIRLRVWLDHMIARELTVAVLHVEAEVGRRLAAVAVAVQHARQVLEYHVANTAAGQTQFDESLRERVGALITSALADLEDTASVAARELDERVEVAVRAGSSLAVEGRWEEMQRRTSRLEGGMAPRTQWVRDRVHEMVGNARHGLQYLRDEIAAVFVDHATPATVGAYRKLLFGPRSTMSDAYQRLFTSVPAESVGLVFERAEASLVRAGIERWLEGRGGPVLVRGDRGMGKRTLIRQVLAGAGERVDAHWLVLSPELEREPEVARSLATPLGTHTVDDFVQLAEAVRSEGARARRERPLAIVVSKTERLFRRTPDGLRRIRRFFDLIGATSGEVLWIVLLPEPAARLLAPVLELEGRFPVTVSVPPLTSEQLERVLSMRHRLSGYELHFAHHRPTLHEWVLHPGTAWQSRRHGGEAFYERLRLLSAGNVRQALRLWIATANLGEDESGGVRVGPLDAVPAALLSSFPLASKVLLAALLLHGPLRRSELSAVTLGQGKELDAEVIHLVHLGLVVLDREPGDDADPLVRVRTRMIAPLTWELRACNLL